MAPRKGHCRQVYLEWPWLPEPFLNFGLAPSAGFPYCTSCVRSWYLSESVKAMASKPNISPSASNPSVSEHPPKPRLAFRVGVVGHRPNRLENSDRTLLSSTISEILNEVKEAVGQFPTASIAQPYSNEEPLLSAISSLAEGVDRVFAERALDLGFTLCCPLPFPREEFNKDFQPDKALEPDSSTQFYSLLNRAGRVFELDGDREHSGVAYAVAARVVVRQSDLLIIVWDGHRLGKPGVTEETFAEARRAGISTVWIDAKAPHHWELLDQTADVPITDHLGRAVPMRQDNRMEELRSVVSRTTQGPQAAESPTRLSTGKRQVGIEDFYAERQPRWKVPMWKWFRDLFGDKRWPSGGFRTTDFDRDLDQEWRSKPTSAISGLIDNLRPFYVWPDRLAIYYSDAYRSAFILVYLAAALAVGAAVLPVASGLDIGFHHPFETSTVLGELFLILFIAGTVAFGRRRLWHERWLDYRLAAELVRHLRISVPLAGDRPLPAPPAHLTNYERASSTWAPWYVRAVERQLGLPNLTVTTAHLRTCLHSLEHMIEWQLEYHRTNAERCYTIEKSLHRLGLLMLGLTFLACAVHLLPMVSHPIPPILTSLAAFLPALGAAFSGINNQGEFRRVFMRSDAMVGQFKDLLEQAQELRQQIEGSTTPKGRQLRSSQVGALGDQVAHLMVSEVLDWRVTLLDRPLTEPA